jgi:hypothetical protein
MTETTEAQIDELVGKICQIAVDTESYTAAYFDTERALNAFCECVGLDHTKNEATAIAAHRVIRAFERDDTSSIKGHVKSMLRALA